MIPADRAADALERVRRVAWAAEPPPAGLRPPRTVLEPDRGDDALRERGEALLRAGKVAVVMAAGGLSTRMGGVLRGLLPVGPVTGCTLFRLQGEKIEALRQRFGRALPWIVVTSRPVHRATRAAFAREGLGNAARFVVQPSLPALDAGLEPVLGSGGAPVLVPTGHGGVLAALAAGGVLRELARRGVEHLFFFQYPNALERVCDPVMLGWHAGEGFDVTLKGFRAYAPGERVGRIADTPAGTRVVEYHAAGGPGAGALDPGLPANLNTLAFRADFLARCVAEGVQLPWHRVPLCLPSVPRAAWRAEQFVFDLLPHAASCGVMLVDRASEYAPVKCPHGLESAPAAADSLLALHREWLACAGATPAVPGARVEITPRFALDAAEVCARVRPGTVYGDGQVF